MLCGSILRNCKPIYRDQMISLQDATPRHKFNLIVRPAPGRPSRAIVQLGHLTFQAAIGRNGRTALKREGDGKTPIATMDLLYGFYRGDRAPKVITRLPLYRTSDKMIWCDAPNDPNYNQIVRRPITASHEEMSRSDGLYDICLVLDWNIRSRKRGAGSAIFMHMIRPGYLPTAGCVALAPKDMRRLLAHLHAGMKVTVL
jgi:L,D-peptidoglycan transpeptidase YkuD (ErfK/YbiS/YcfS/YnhG family)